MVFELDDLCLCLVDIKGVKPSIGRLEAMKMIAEHLENGTLLGPEIRDWFCSSVATLERGHKPEMSQAAEQRLLSKSFGFTARQGATESWRDGYEMAKEIHTIKVMENCGAEQAVERYVARRFPKREAEVHDTIRRAYYRHKKAVAPSVEEWAAMQE